MKQEPRDIPTMETVAKEAGVSKMTVSRVLNKHPYVNKNTRSKILKLIERLNYKPNITASVLSRKTSKTLGVIIQIQNLFSTYYLTEVMKGIEEAADSHGFNMVLFSRINPAPKNYEDIAGWYYGGLIKGFIIVAPTSDMQLISELSNDNIPYIIVGSKNTKVEADYVDCDNVKGAYIAAEYLIKNAHTDICFISGLKERLDSREREKGFLKALSDYGLKPKKELMLTGDYIERTAYIEMNKLLDSKNIPSAVFASNDLMAFGAMTAIKERGLSIPYDISVIGFDDIDSAKYTTPPLTTIKQPIKQLGVLAGEYFMENDDGDTDKKIKKILDVFLVIRKTVAPKRNVNVKI